MECITKKEKELNKYKTVGEYPLWIEDGKPNKIMEKMKCHLSLHTSR